MAISYNTTPQDSPLSVLGSGSGSGAGTGSFVNVGSFTNKGNIGRGYIRLRMRLLQASSGTGGLGIGNDNTAVDISDSETLVSFDMEAQISQSVADTSKVHMNLLWRYNSSGGGNNFYDNATFNLSADEEVFVYVRSPAGVNYTYSWIAEKVRV